MATLSVSSDARGIDVHALHESARLSRSVLLRAGSGLVKPFVCRVSGMVRRFATKAHSMSNKLRVSSFAWGLLVVIASGCGGKGITIVPVTGTVTWNGNPVSRADVGFMREAVGGKEPAPPATAVTGEDGGFRLMTNGHDGAVPGKYKVTIQKSSKADMNIPRPLPEGFHTDIQYMMAHNLVPYALLPPQYAGSDKTPLTLEVSADPEKNKFEIKIEGAAPPKPTGAKAAGPRSADFVPGK